ncbi:MAG: hypothetical protein HKN67_12265 [Saprospiraceae bacterium]|nr:hypothetical protein [Saprospiraceae bacterium]
MERLQFNIFTILVIAFACLLPCPVQAHEGHAKKIKFYNKKIKENPANPENYFLRGVQYQSHGDFNEAKIDFLKVLSLQQDHQSVYYHLGTLYLENNLLDSALIYTNKYIEMNPGVEKGYECRANIYHEGENYELARRDYLKAIQIVPEQTIEMYFALSHNEMAAGDIEAAKSVLQDGMNKLGRIIPLRKALIDIAVNEKSWEEAHVLLDEIIQEMQRKETWYLLKAETYQAAGDIISAKAYYEKALEEIQKLSKNNRRKKHIRNLKKTISDRLNALN